MVCKKYYNVSVSKKVRSGDFTFLDDLYCKSTLFFEKCKKYWYFCKVMLQRIQTVFLVLVALSAVALHFTGMDVVVFGSMYINATLSLISFILAGISILSYKNRKRQVVLNNINLIINALLICLLIYWLLNLSGGINFPEKGVEPIFSVISMFCLLMANHYIRKDDRLVKSVDRLR